MKQLTKAQLICINTIISKQNIAKEIKEMIVHGFTAGRSTSSKDLYYEEAAIMIKHLKSTDPHREASEKMRRKVLYFAHEMGWVKLKNGRLIADIQRVDEWCIKFGHVKRKLDNYPYKELPKLVSQFQAVYKHYIQSL